MLSRACTAKKHRKNLVCKNAVKDIFKITKIDNNKAFKIRFKLV